MEQPLECGGYGGTNDRTTERSEPRDDDSFSIRRSWARSRWPGPFEVAMTGGINWGPILVLFVLPLCFGGALLLVASRFRPRWARITARILASVCLLVFLAAVF